MPITTTESGYSTDYKLCYSSDIQRLIGLLRKNGFDDKHPDTATLLNSLSMSVKKWKTPTGVYYVMKYTKNVFHPMYSADALCVSQHVPAADAAASGIDSSTAHSALEANIQGRGLFRSVILDNTGQIVSFSPPKTLRCNDAADLNAVQSLNTSDFSRAFSYIEEFVEGTMFHLFRAPGPVPTPTSTSTAEATPFASDALTLSGWEISTKGVVGAGVFVPAPTTETSVPITFRHLFLEAIVANKIDLTTLNTNYAYSLVLQHPKNPMIAPVVEPRLYYIAAYTVDNETLTVTRHPRNAVDWKGAGFYVPRNYAHDPMFSSIHMKYANPTGTTPYRVMGVVFHGSRHAGWSFKLRNPAYETAKKTPMDAKARMFFMYCSLKRSKEIKQHLALFPEDVDAFNEFNTRILEYAKHVYSKYVDVFILKTTAHAICGSKFVKAILYGLHRDVYCVRRNGDSSHGSKITFTDVLQYISNVVPPVDLFNGVNLNLNLMEVIDAKPTVEPTLL
jgi:hypothetical protein